jgi:hypothetical protein
MAINLSTLQPTKISRDLKGKFMLVYGEPKSGKTSLATCFPKSLLVAFEKGYNALPNIMAIDAPTWVAMKEILRELKKPDIQNRFDTIIIDTASIAWDRCSEYICQQNQVSDLTEIAWGKGTKACSREFEKVFREITLLGYGLVFLAHAEEKVPFQGDESQAYIAPMLDKRPYRIVNGMVDIISCIDVNKETGERFLQLRSTPRIVAGCRFKYMPDRIPLDYEELVNSLAEAIEKQGEASGGMIVDERIDLGEEDKERPFDEAMDEARKVWTAILENDDSDAMLERMMQVIEDQFGSRIKLSQTTPKQQGLLELAILELKDLLATLG